MRQDDEQDHHQVEDADDRSSRLQPVGGHQLDRPEVGRERHTERGLEALGERLRSLRGRQVGQLHVPRDDPHGLQLGQGGADHRKDIERHVPVGDAHRVEFVT